MRNRKFKSEKLLREVEEKYPNEAAALLNDDGVSANYDEADIILLGVSRSGKTPTCLYLALQYGVKAANYPLVEDDLDKDLKQILLEKIVNTIKKEKEVVTSKEN